MAAIWPLYQTDQLLEKIVPTGLQLDRSVLLQKTLHYLQALSVVLEGMKSTSDAKKLTQLKDEIAAHKERVTAKLAAYGKESNDNK